MTNTHRTDSTHTSIHNHIIHDRRLPAGVFRSYARLRAAAGEAGSAGLGPIDYAGELARLLDVSPTQTREHLNQLRSQGLLTWEADGSGQYRITFLSPDLGKPVFRDAPTPENRETGFPVSGVEMMDSSSLKIKNKTHPTTSSGKPVFQSAGELQERAFEWLCRAGVWAEPARKIAAQLEANAARPYNAYLPGLGDLLGWMAYAFADGGKHGVENPAALLAANLHAGRRCPDRYRPPLVCEHCRREAGRCACPEPAYGYPEEFCEYAFENQYDATWETFWGICRYCHTFGCDCRGES